MLQVSVETYSNALFNDYLNQLIKENRSNKIPVQFLDPYEAYKEARNL